MKNNLKNTFRFVASKRAVTKLAAAVLIVAVIAAFSVAAGGIYYLLAVANSSWITISPTPTPTTNSTPTPTPSSVTPPTATPTLPPTRPPSTPTPKPSVTTQPTNPTSPPSTPTPQPPQPTPTPTPVSYPKYSLSEAISAGYVESSITGLGGGASSGISIVQTIKRAVNYTIELEPLPTGTLLTSSNNAQNMVVQRVYGLVSSMTNYTVSYYLRDQIILDNSNVTQYIYLAYCVNFHKGNPSLSTTFAVSGTADPNVIKILTVVSSNQLPSNVTSTGAIQTAISVVTDNPSRSELQSTWPSFVAEIPNAKTILDTAGIDTSNANLFK